jgi:hypothetical protein
MSSSNNASASANAMSICIPRVFDNITEDRVRNVFGKLDIFTIERVDMVKRSNEKGEKFQRVFVHIKDWSNSANALKAKGRLLEGKELKIVYDDPWFWKVSLNTWTQKPKPSVVYDRKPKIRIEFDEEDNRQKSLPVASGLVIVPPLREYNQDPRDYRDDRAYRDPRDNRDYRDPRDNRDNRAPALQQKECRDPRANRDPRAYRDNKYNASNRRPQEHKVKEPEQRDHRDGYGAIIYPEDKSAQKALTVELVETNQPTDSQSERLDNEATTEAAAPLALTPDAAPAPAPAPLAAEDTIEVKPKSIKTKEQKLKTNDLLAQHRLSPQVI